MRSLRGIQSASVDFIGSCNKKATEAVATIRPAVKTAAANSLA